MKTNERPILFSGEMVRAILDGRKTLTRRVVKSGVVGRLMHGGQRAWPYGYDKDHQAMALPCPYGQPGDKLWVRETWFCTGADESDGYPVRYRQGATVNEDVSISWCPSIFMPRWASRITLEVTGVRVERLQEITSGGYMFASDVQREGCPFRAAPGGLGGDEVTWFMGLWDSLNAKRGFGWDKNPWVWVVEFRRLV